jgi:lipoprotein-anchoring transpeptidase ErfK/SrfK
MRATVVIAAIVGVLLVLAGGVSLAAYRYEQARADRILPGVTIAGVDVGGMTRAEALASVKGAIREQLDRSLVITVGGGSWESTSFELGRRADVASAVDAALAVGDAMGTFDRFWHRFRSEPVEEDLAVTFRTGGGAVERLVDTMAGAVAVAPRAARMGLDPDATELRFVRAKEGRKLATARSVALIEAALEGGATSLSLPTRAVAPTATAKDLGPTIVVWVDRNRLELYDGFRVERTYDVATAKPGYVTPTGVWTIWDKRENPTWYNPALDSWGADLPAVVPGGPGNPMGTRAIYIDAPGLIRIHGTTDPSSIGRYASHGCIRMHNEDVEDLFERIPVGAHVIVVGHRPANASYWDTPGNADI